MRARYLIRLDDACPTMDSGRWGLLERIFDQLGVRPIVAVVPDNVDPELQVEPADKHFWDKVRAWQAKGWTIAMHGYQHRFHWVDRRRLVLPFYDRSEFAGLDYEEQVRKLRASWALFERERVLPTVWIAPAHCFDRTTLRALTEATPIRVVSDGIAREQYVEDDFHWLPQQLWNFAPRTTGLWTICLHPNSMTPAAIEQLGETLHTPARQGLLTAVSDIQLRKRRRSLADRTYAGWFWNRSRFYSGVAAIRRRLASGGAT